MQLRPVLRACFPDIPPVRLPGGFDRVGDIAVVGIVPELEALEREIGKIILRLHKTIRVVAKRDGQYGGEYRTRPLWIIAGEERLTTIHRENGITLHLDLAQVYFSVRSAHERGRIAALVQPGERVGVLCSGIGPFQLPLTTLAILMGGHVRVGMEDNVYYRRGEKLKSNAQAVERTVRIARELNREIATPAEARRMLGISGTPSVYA